MSVYPGNYIKSIIQCRWISQINLRVIFHYVSSPSSHTYTHFLKLTIKLSHECIMYAWKSIRDLPKWLMSQCTKSKQDSPNELLSGHWAALLAFWQTVWHRDMCIFTQIYKLCSYLLQLRSQLMGSPVIPRECTSPSRCLPSSASPPGCSSHAIRHGQAGSKWQY